MAEIAARVTTAATLRDKARTCRAAAIFSLAAYGLLPNLLFLTALLQLVNPEAETLEKLAAAALLLVSLGCYAYISSLAKKLLDQAADLDRQSRKAARPA